MSASGRAPEADEVRLPRKRKRPGDLTAVAPRRSARLSPPPPFVAMNGTARSFLASILERFPSELVELLVSFGWEWHVFIESRGPRCAGAHQLYFDSPREAAPTPRERLCALWTRHRETKSLPVHAALARSSGNEKDDDRQGSAFSGLRFDAVDASRSPACVCSSSFSDQQSLLRVFRNPIDAQDRSAPLVEAHLPGLNVGRGITGLRFHGADWANRRVYYWSLPRSQTRYPWKWCIVCVDAAKRTVSLLDTDFVLPKTGGGDRLAFLIRDAERDCFWSLYRSREPNGPSPWRMNVLRLDWSAEASLFRVSQFPARWTPAPCTVVRSFCLLPPRSRSPLEGPSFCATTTNLGAHDKRDSSYVVGYSLNHVTLDLDQMRSTWDTRECQAPLSSHREKNDVVSSATLLPSVADPDTVFVLLGNRNTNGTLSPPEGVSVKNQVTVLRCVMGLGARPEVHAPAPSLTSPAL